ncbi:hypothetical protein NEILACOT_05686 [Neisseria lactamica ATCC 23970]|uniref:Uncharacterized protein n=1 Tax=Neisseria lactamica ATCC 23970 TaxID=546265 RepID=D0WDP9_NEILA|nr:hypothetical protein NEILACOT_05686 [Neisseria lactamica ATCC 23970]
MPFGFVQFGVGFIAAVILGFQTTFELRFGFGFIFCSGFWRLLLKVCAAVTISEVALAIICCFSVILAKSGRAATARCALLLSLLIPSSCVVVSLPPMFRRPSLRVA